MNVKKNCISYSPFKNTRQKNLLQRQDFNGNWNAFYVISKEHKDYCNSFFIK